MSLWCIGLKKSKDSGRDRVSRWFGHVGALTLFGFRRIFVKKKPATARPKRAFYLPSEGLQIFKVRVYSHAYM